jgi:small subunit ribosomal protein S21
MATVELGKGESQESLIRRFLRKVKKSEIIKEVWERQYYQKPSAVKNEKKRKRKRVLEKLKKERQQEELTN